MASVLIYFISLDPCRAWPKRASIIRDQRVEENGFIRYVILHSFFFFFACWSSSVSLISFYMFGWMNTLFF